MSVRTVAGTRQILSNERSGKGFVWHLRCGHDVVRPTSPQGRVSAVCPTCRKAAQARPSGDAVSIKELRKWRRERGLCWECEQPAAAGRTLCEAHLSVSRARYRAQKQPAPPPSSNATAEKGTEE